VFASSAGLLLPALGGRWREGVMLAATLAFWAAINVRGVTVGSRLNGVATVAKLVPLILLATAGLFFIEPANLQWAGPPATADVARTSLLLIFAFAGVEVAVVPGGEVRDVARTVPRAIAVALIGVTVLYILLQLVSQGVLGDALARSTVSPLADAAAASLGGWAGSLLLAGATISMFGHLGGVTLAMPRIVYALARDGFLPRALGRVHPRSHAPQAAILFQSALTLGLAVSGTFEKLAILANVSALALYLGCALAAWRLRTRAVPAATGGVLHGPLGAAAPWLACLVIAWLLTGLARDEWIAFGACVAAASLVYLMARKREAA
jgi:amino acid transporter